MAYKVRCSACGKSMRLPDGEAGMAVVCLACGTKFTAPPPVDPKPPQPAAASSPSVAVSVPPPLPAIDSPVFEEAPLRISWGIATAICAVLVLLALGVWKGFHSLDHRSQVNRVEALLEEAQDLAGRGELAAAHEKYRELDRVAREAGRDDPELNAIADQALLEQEQVNAMRLASLPPVPPPAVPPPPRTPVIARADSPSPSPATAPVDPRPGTHTASAEVNSAPPPAPSPPEIAATTKPLVPAPPVARIVKRPPLRPVPEPLTGVTDEQIGEAIVRGVGYLIPLFDKKSGQFLHGGRRGDDEGYVCGLNALCVYALLQSGQAINDQRLDIHGPFMKSLMEGMKRLPANNGKATYARGIRATALALYNRKEDQAALRADVNYLLLTHINGAYTYAGTRSSSANRAGGPWDNSNSQYGLLGVWSGAEVGVEVPSKYWSAVQKHWTTNQGPDGTWSYTRGTGGGTVSMTAAGTASLFVADDYLYGARYGVRVGREPFSEPLKRALDWWERGGGSNAGNDLLRRGMAGWWGYTMYGIERVGLASGFKYFGKHDWYRELAGRIVDRQQRLDGSWGDPIDTAYALLFLARGRHPILMNKLRFDKGGSTGDIPGYWGNRPRDAANLARYAGRQLERPLNWQVVGLAVPWYDWLDSPILSIASHRTPYFTDADCDKFRSYVEAGGMLYLQADGESQEFDAFARKFARRLFPQYEMKELPPGHVLNTCVYKLPASNLKAVTNGTRVLILYSPRDIAKAWQLRDEKNREGDFKFGVNLFVYAAGKRELRNRLSSIYVSTPERRPPNGIIDVARVKYAGSWDPEPGAWRRFANWFHRRTGTALAVDVVSLDRLGRSESTPRFAHLTGNVAYKPTEDEIASLRSYVAGGGVLFIDACGGDAAFSDSMKAALSQAFPEQVLRPLNRDHALLQDELPGMDDLRRPRVRTFVMERFSRSSPRLQSLQFGKGAVIFSELDVVSGLLGTETWGIYGYDPAFAQSMMKNLVFWTVDGHRD